MPKCPHCSTNILSIQYEAQVVQHESGFVSLDEYVDGIKTDFRPQRITKVQRNCESFKCPHCQNEISFTLSQTIKFLQS